jgi:hypothetical protein
MKKKILLAIGVAGLALASAKSYSITLFQPAMFGATQLAAGSYKVEVDGNKAVVRSGKQVCEAPVKVENADSKYSTTAVRFDNTGGQMRIQEIHVGGSKTKLVFNE